MVFQPFETFDICVGYAHMRGSGINFPITNAQSTLIILTIFPIASLYINVNNAFLLTSNNRNLLGAVVRSGSRQTYDQHAIRSAPWSSSFVPFSTIISSSNYLGLLPFAPTLTSHSNYVFILTASVFVGMTLRVFTDNSRNFVTHFVPDGVPFAIGASSFVAEIISYSLRAISLPVRVSANMVAGHVLSFPTATAPMMISETWDSINMKLSPILILSIWFAVFHPESPVAFSQAHASPTMIPIYSRDMGSKHNRFIFFRTLFKKVISKIPRRVVKKERIRPFYTAADLQWDCFHELDHIPRWYDPYQDPVYRNMSRLGYIYHKYFRKYIKRIKYKFRKNKDDDFRY